MKATVVPAQVTTVEDRIAGNLGFSQLLLLATPVFAGGLLYVVLPPFMNNAAYKMVLIGVLAFIFWTMAIRIKGTILLLWLVIVLRYNLRPSLYVFNKNTLKSREQYRDTIIEENEPQEATNTARETTLQQLGIADTVRALDIINNPASKVRFETNRKGKLYVRFTEIKEES